MHEGDPGAAPALAGFLIHEESAFRLKMGYSCFDIDHGIGDVVQSLPPSLQEPADRGTGMEGGQQLDEGPADRQHGLLDALLLYHLPVHGGHPVPATMLLYRFVQVVYRDGYMVEVEELHRDSVARRTASSGTVPYRPVDDGSAGSGCPPALADRPD